MPCRVGRRTARCFIPEVRLRPAPAEPSRQLLAALGSPVTVCLGFPWRTSPAPGMVVLMAARTEHFHVLLLARGDQLRRSQFAASPGGESVGMVHDERRGR